MAENKPSLSQEQLADLRKVVETERLNLIEIDKLSLIDVDKSEIERMRKNSNDNIEKALKILSVYGNG